MSAFEPETAEYATGYETEPASEHEEEEEVYETGEQQQFLGDILGSVLGSELQSPLTETQEAEFASELLEVDSEEQLEQFLGNILKGAAKAVGGLIKSPVGQALGGVLKNVAKKALPVVGGALGSFVAPGVGTAIGSKLGSMASNMFEIDVEGMDPHDAEFEVAKRIVRLTASAGQHAATAPPHAPARQVAHRAFVQAARVHAPGALRGTPHPGHPHHAVAAPRTHRPAPQTPGYRRPAPSVRPVPGARPGRPSTVFARAPWEPGWAPGLYDGVGYPSTGEPVYGDGVAAYGLPSAGRHRSGRWIRRGRKIILMGV
jgi:uncharacterized protein (DUF697 family)